MVETILSEVGYPVDYLKRAKTRAEARTPEAIAGGSAQPLNTEGEEIV